ncbi:MAG: Hsp20/alpha crystallin family protein [Phycisphaerales bacterium]
MAMEPQTAEARQTEGTRREGQGRCFQPATDIIETPGAVLLKLDMPGVAKEDINLTVDKDTLMIVGKAEPEQAGEAVYARRMSVITSGSSALRRTSIPPTSPQP